MSASLRRALHLIIGALLVVGVVGGCGDGARTFTVRGTVHDVQTERGQALVEHEDIPGLMPAMTMSFDVPDAEVVSRMRSGQVIDFELAFDGRSYAITGFEVVGTTAEEEGWVRFGDALVRSDPAPDFSLVDHASRRVDLGDFSGRVLLVDFIFTRCPGPCPILTTSHVRTWRALPVRVHEQVHFVSISVDPENDTPDALRAYAEARGVDLGSWSFLTGTPGEIEPVLEAFGVGRTRGDDGTGESGSDGDDGTGESGSDGDDGTGESGSDADGGTIEHTVITYLVDGEGRIVKRYFGLLHEPEALAADVVTLVDTPVGPSGEGPAS